MVSRKQRAKVWRKNGPGRRHNGTQRAQGLEWGEGLAVPGKKGGRWGLIQRERKATRWDRRPRAGPVGPRDQGGELCFCSQYNERSLEGSQVSATSGVPCSHFSFEKIILDARERAEKARVVKQ